MSCWKKEVLEVLKDLRAIALDSNNVLHRILDKFEKASIIILKGETSMKINQKITVTAVPTNALGLPGTIDSPISWSVNDANLASITPSSDGTTADVVSKAAGTLIVTASAIANGVQISGDLTVTIDTPAQNFATTIVLTASDPVDVPTGNNP